MSAEKKDPSDLGRRVLSALEEAKANGLLKSQNDLELKSGVGRGYVSRIVSGDRGHRMDPGMLKRIADALGVRYEWLAQGSGPRHAMSGELKIDIDERYPNRARAVARARAAGVDERAIEWARRMVLRPELGDKLEGAWFAIIAAKAAELEEHGDDSRGRVTGEFPTTE